MAKRAQFSDVVIDTEGNALDNVQVDVYAVGTTNSSTIYSGRTGASTETNPITTDSTGLIEFWADGGTYDIKLTDLDAPARFTTRTFTWESLSGDTDGIDGVVVIDNIAASQIIGDTTPSDGSVTNDKLSSSLARELGVDNDTTTSRAKVVTSGEQNITSVGTFVVIDNADVYVPTDGLLFILWRGFVKKTGSGDGELQVRIDGTSLADGDSDTNWLSSQGISDTTYHAMWTQPMQVNDENRLLWRNSGGTNLGSESADPITYGGNDLGGETPIISGSAWSPIVVEVPSDGVYNVEIAGRVASGGGGTLSVKQRTLRLWTMDF